ncbi:MAG: L-aspartate oxidase [Solirubrobacteraceae bacterium]|nr:L-aspartate oxidase [Solirubrobacteraceae bacterium]
MAVSPPTAASDVVVVGAGAAGLYAAHSAAREGGRVLLISATPLAETASYWAQGGLAAALAADDSPEQHLADTIAAGRGLVREAAARVLVDEAPGIVADLESLGVHFDADRHGRLALGLEGGHSRRRVVHAGGSTTGRRVVRQLSAIVAEHERITIWERTRAARLWTDGNAGGRVIGVVCDDGRAATARAVVIATGGTAALWSRTTNPPGSIGIGLMLAHGAGAALADLELMQFHPTAVIGVPGREGFLITEAIRGEGATLHAPGGERFVEELAPRDEVARAIDRVLRETGATHVGLDMRSVDPARFPNVVEALRDAGVDPATELVPVAPASHYLMGGVQADIDGRSTVPGLLVAGESACTGLHGANRLASNSLSECFVLGRRAARAALDEPPPPKRSGPTPEPAPIPIPDRAAREALWRDAGLVRSAEGLERLSASDHPLVALIAACALLRTETRGGHCRADFPERAPALDLHHAVVGARRSPAFQRWA